MKRCGILLMISLALVVCTSASFAIFPTPSGYTQVQLYHGWWSPGIVPPGELPTAAWYSCFATNNVRVAQTQSLTLSPKLSNFTALPVMYVVTNFSNDGPVFFYSPHPISVIAYSGIWAVVYIRWLPTATPHVITNGSLANAGNPTGLPPVTEAVYSLTVNGPPIGAPPFFTVGPAPGITVVDCPIFAIGNISNPWFKPTSFVRPYVYRIPQGVGINTYTKRLTIPFWYVYCRNGITRAISVLRVIIPDASEISLARLLKANFAPNLGIASWLPPQPSPLGMSSTMYVTNWNQIVPPGTPLKVLANQYPLLDACPTSCDWRNTNRNYSPVDAFVLLNRNLPLISPEVLFNNWEFVVQQIMAGGLVSVPPCLYPPHTPGPRVNAPVLCVQPL